MLNPCIPLDVVFEILRRLPVESIIRFRYVSKSWNSLISSASFISTQTHLARITNTLLLGDCTWKFDDQPIRGYKKLDIPQIGFGVEVNGSIHGLICLSSVVPVETIIIWNPALRISIQLPEFNFETQTPYYFPTIGFGFDVKRNDYKVIRTPNPSSDVTRQYEVFELSQNAWKIVTPNKFPPDLCDLPPVYLNGSAHWISKLATIVAFDFVDEAFLDMNLPGALKNLEFVKIVVKENRYLSAIDYYGEICVWVMKEYGVEESWSKLFTIHEPIMGNLQEPICFRKNGELLVREKDEMLVSYDCLTSTVTPVAKDEFPFVVDHTETLALFQVLGGDMRYKVEEGGSRIYVY